jgi:hypothetical protein
MEYTQATGGPSADQIREWLASDRPEAVTAALRGMGTRLAFGEDFPLPPFGAEVLGAFDDVPDETQLLLLDVVDTWPFEPPAVADHWMSTGLDLVLRFGSGRLALEVELRAVTSDDPVGTARAALGRLAATTLTPIGAAGAKAFVSYLLDARPEVRDATIAALSAWPRDGAHDEVVGRLAPELAPRERAQLPQLDTGNGNTP